jgi:hypothetical protein
LKQSWRNQKFYLLREYGIKKTAESHGMIRQLSISK